MQRPAACTDLGPAKALKSATLATAAVAEETEDCGAAPLTTSAGDARPGGDARDAADAPACADAPAVASAPAVPLAAVVRVSPSAAPKRRRAACSICSEFMGHGAGAQTYWPCCGQLLCSACSTKLVSVSHSTKCALCRAPRPKDKDEWLHRMRKRACSDAEAAYQLAAKYLEGGTLLEKNDRMACALFEKAADQRHARAECMLAYCRSHAVGCAEDAPAAAKLYERAANGGDPTGMTNHAAGLLRRNGGDGGDAAGDAREALSLYARAAHEGHPEAQVRLASVLLTGAHGTRPDPEAAVKLLHGAQTNGHAQAAKILRHLEPQAPAEAPRTTPINLL
ncbi:hypothetical protein M885DRAFT_518728 [Pelagophyceae sp. CCMP2097]|nr:hypothetical protein M885DRAFT_518728 [Pelagophyceae sp. CCMP2097]